MNPDTATPKQKRPVLTLLGCMLIATMAWHSLAPRFAHGDTLAQTKAAQIAQEALSSGLNSQLTPQELAIRFRPDERDNIGLATFAWDHKLPLSCEPQALGYRLCKVGLPK